jgi:hypothetical protein
MSRLGFTADPILPAEADFAQVPGKRGQRADSGQRCTWTGAGACVRVSHTVPQGHNVSLLDVMAIEMRDAPATVDVC